MRLDRSPLLLLSLVLAACSGSYGSDPLGDDPDGPGSPPMPKMPPAQPLEMGPIEKAETSPPPLSGGTLAAGMLGDAEIAVASDPDSDRIYVVDISKSKLAATVQLEKGSEPGRVALDGSGRAHVALRRAGGLATIDLTTGKLVSIRAVCPAPRGVAYDEAQKAVLVACMGGELVSLPAGGGDEIFRWQLDRDLRDVVVSGEEIVVSRFKSAELVVLERDGHGQVRDRAAPAFLAFSNPGDPSPGQFTASVAWRMLPSPSGGAIVLHQRGATKTVATTQPGGYGSSGGCNTGIVHGAISRLREGGIDSTGAVSVGLAIDAAVSPDGSTVALALPADVASGGAGGPVSGAVELRLGAGAPSPCGNAPSEPIAFNGQKGQGGPPPGQLTAELSGISFGFAGQTVAVAYTPSGKLLAQMRSPAAIGWASGAIKLPSPPAADTGHRIFHMDSGGGLACASCHPEGGDDGRTWNFEKLGPRRTQALAGGIKGSEPFHWSGDMSDFGVLVDEVFVHRMGGPQPSQEQAAALLDWIDTMPLPPAAAPLDQGAIDRGRVLFESAEVGCATCHGGDRLSNNATVDVGTGSPLQVPSLRRAVYHAPFLHDGCAPDMRGRFGACGGGDAHGHTSQLDGAQIGDLAAYLESL
jgi:mono/diheme cytochrome c family protein